MGRFFMNSIFLYLLMTCVSLVFSAQVIDDDKDGYADKDELHTEVSDSNIKFRKGNKCGKLKL